MSVNVRLSGNGERFSDSEQQQCFRPTALGPVDKKNIYYKDVPRDLTNELWRQCRDATEPLRRSGKLAVVHFQFAPWVAFHPRNRDRIEECQRLEGHQPVIVTPA